MTTTSINRTEITNSAQAIINGHCYNDTLMAQQAQDGEQGSAHPGRPESELRAAARRKGLTLKELAALMGVELAATCAPLPTATGPGPPDLREKGPRRCWARSPARASSTARAARSPARAAVIRERAREKGMTLKDLAVAVGVSYRYMTQAARGQRNMSPRVQARVESALGGPAEIAAAECANRRRHGPVKGETTWIRERARELGMSMRELAEEVGVSLAYLSQVARGLRNMGPAVQARMEAALGEPARVEPAQRPSVDPRALWDRMDAHGISQNEAARRAGISNALLSQIMNGQRTPSGKVLRKLHEVLFRPSAAELVVPAEVKVMAWKKDERQGVVIKGVGGPGACGNNPGGGTVRIGGRVPWGADVEYAYRAGYDGRGQVSVAHLVDERGYGVMLAKPEPGAA